MRYFYRETNRATAKKQLSSCKSLKTDDEWCCVPRPLPGKNFSKFILFLKTLEDSDLCNFVLRSDKFEEVGEVEFDEMIGAFKHFWE